MEAEVRNQIEKMVQNARRLLEQEIHDQLEGVYGLHKDGNFEDVSSLPKIKDNSDALKERKGFEYFISNEVSQGIKKKDAVNKLVLGLSFTHFNRLIALKLMERRKVIRESISRKTDSNGFKFFLADYPEQMVLWTGGKNDEVYKNFLLHQYGLISEEIHVLFDPEDVSNLIFPKPRTLYDLLDLINQESLADVWEEDETIGWIYQYFTPKELIKKARSESPAPRNSYELAFRNQFYTPRYVVRFLTDNTLGRTWYEMRRGDTKLTEICEYMVRRPNEIFLEKGEEAPEIKEKTDQTREELLNEPFYIPYRAKKDPREIKTLDPATGSGHFLLYCFDILQIIYEEAYEDPDLSSPLRADYPSIEEYRKAIPGLILRHNLHGIDIDLRATQIASLALWLRAQKAYQEMGLKAEERPKITKSNIVCAEPMPGNETVLKEFKRNLQPAVLGDFVTDVWNEMKLAGEAGSLLKIEETITNSVKEAKEAWLARPKDVQLDFYGNKKFVEQMRFNLRGIKDKMFWEDAEELLIDSLKRFAEEASNGDSYPRKLFAENAAHSFAFIDVLSKKYDVVLMNPPFGAASDKIEKILYEYYPTWNKNLLCAFIDRVGKITEEDGAIGVIFDRTAMVKSTYEKFRKEVLLGSESIYTLADTGWEVLDANVETTTVVFQKNNSKISNTATFFDVRNVNSTEKCNTLIKLINSAKLSHRCEDLYIEKPEKFLKLPNSVIGYDMPEIAINAFSLGKSFELATVGLQAKSDQFMRYFWEVNNNFIGRKKDYSLFYKGGEYSLYYLPTKQIIYWKNEGEIIKKHPSSRQENKEYFIEGLCYGKRGDFVDTHILRKDHIYSDEGLGIPLYGNMVINRWYFLSLLNSKFVHFIINLYCGQHKHVGYVNLLPVVEDIPKEIKNNLSLMSKKGYYLKSDWYKGDETNYQFSLPWLLLFYQPNIHTTLKELLCLVTLYEKKSDSDLENISNEIDRLIFELYNVEDQKDIYIVNKAVERRSKDILWKETRGYPTDQKESYHVESLLSFWIGCVFGRWDSVNGSFYDEKIMQDGYICDLEQILRDEEIQLREKDVLISENIKFTLNESDLYTNNPLKVKYPYDIDSDGIIPLENGHPEDIVNQIVNSISITFGVHKTQTILKEIEDVLGTDLRKYFGTKFFNSHVNRYSKAPIYWQVSSKNQNYSLWIYYHKMTSDTLFLCIRKYIDPKVEYEETRLTEMKQKLETEKEALPRSQITKREKEIEKKADFVVELKEFRDTMEKIAQSGYDPDFDDGVILNMAPLHKVIPWKEPAKYWKELEAGDYDWAHIAMKYWPERVKEKCRKDKSLAIAHGLEELYDGDSN